MTKVEERLKAEGIKLPECPVPVASYISAKVADGFVYVSGQTAIVDGELKYTGKVGDTVSPEDGYQSARIAAIRCISELRSVADLDKLEIVKVCGFVNAVPEYTEQPKVINGASDLILFAFGERGKHTRTAVGVGSLPACASVEVDLIARIVE